ncbi:MAG: HEAT repeat domain-containing protein [Thermoanaerobaculia bacterium]
MKLHSVIRAFLITTYVVLMSIPLLADDGCPCNDSPPFLQRPPAAEIARLGRASSANLAKSLGEAHCDIAVEASLILGRRHDARSVRALLSAAEGSRCRVREGSVQALHSFRRQDVRAVLIRAIGDGDPRVRTAAARSLSGQDDGDSKATDALIAAMSDPSKHLRQAAADSLGHLGNPAARRVLTRALNDPEKHVRQAAAEALGNLRSK